MGKTRRKWPDLATAERDGVIMAEMARSAEERERKQAEFIRRCTTNPVGRRVVEDLIPIQVQQVVKQGIRLIRSHGMVVQAEARVDSQDGFLRISIPGAPTSRTFRLVPLSQARLNMPVFDGTVTWLAVDGHGNRVKTIYMCPVTRACGSKQDFNAKYLSQRLGKRRRLRLKGHRIRARMSRWRRATKGKERLADRLKDIVSEIRAIEAASKDVALATSPITRR
jgi:hypothetical protein